jgi:hypothetical protein
MIMAETELDIKIARNKVASLKDELVNKWLVQEIGQKKRVKGKTKGVNSRIK